MHHHELIHLLFSICHSHNKINGNHNMGVIHKVFSHECIASSAKYITEVTKMREYYKLTFPLTKVYF